MKVFITGIAGVLGSSLAHRLLSEGYDVAGNDIQRIDGAWRLYDIMHDIKYLWKSTVDLEKSDIEGYDIIVDAGIGYADRPFGNSSPIEMFMGNLLPPIRLLELIRRLSKSPIVAYPSSFNALYGFKGKYDEKTPVSPASVYGWSKSSAELLYQTYYREYGVKAIITRVGSAYGPMGREDELPHRMMIHLLKYKYFKLRSPYAKRLWSYSKDVMEFYSKLLPLAEEFIGNTLIVAGNKGDKIVTNDELSKIIMDALDIDGVTIEHGEYEPGELLDGKPIDFKVNAKKTRKAVGWSPSYTLEEGIRETAEWFKKNLHRYT